MKFVGLSAVVTFVAAAGATFCSFVAFEIWESGLHATLGYFGSFDYFVVKIVDSIVIGAIVVFIAFISR